MLAVDPSSQISGGSILGDKTRMTALASSPMAFIRPSPSRGSLGGVAQRTREAMLLCEAAGYRNILVETVGVGQSETAVHDMVDFFLLIMLAGAGDELQGIKRGVMEMADLVAINKADGPNLPPPNEPAPKPQNALHYLPASPSGWTPRALTCSAQTGKGIAELWNAVLEHTALTKANGWFAHARREQTRSWMHEIIQEGLRPPLRIESRYPPRMEALDRMCSKDAPHPSAPPALCSKCTKIKSRGLATPAISLAQAAPLNLCDFSTTFITKQVNVLSPGTSIWCGTPAGTCATSPARNSCRVPPSIALATRLARPTVLAPVTVPPVTSVASPVQHIKQIGMVAHAPRLRRRGCETTAW